MTHIHRGVASVVSIVRQYNRTGLAKNNSKLEDRGTAS